MAQSQKKPKRRWWKFSLRTFICSIAVICIGIASFLRMAKEGESLYQKQNDVWDLAWEFPDEFHRFPKLPTGVDFQSPEMQRAMDRQTRFAMEQAEKKMDEFNRKHWLQLKAYDLAVDWGIMKPPPPFY